MKNINNGILNGSCEKKEEESFNTFKIPELFVLMTDYEVFHDVIHAKLVVIYIFFIKGLFK